MAESRLEALEIENSSSPARLPGMGVGGKGREGPGGGKRRRIGWMKVGIVDLGVSRDKGCRSRRPLFRRFGDPISWHTQCEPGLGYHDER